MSSSPPAMELSWRIAGDQMTVGNELHANFKIFIIEYLNSFHMDEQRARREENLTKNRHIQLATKCEMISNAFARPVHINVHVLLNYPAVYGHRPRPAEIVPCGS